MTAVATPAPTMTTAPIEPATNLMCFLPSIVSAPHGRVIAATIHNDVPANGTPRMLAGNDLQGSRGASSTSNGPLAAMREPDHGA
jgi:hypothetical protein